MKADKKKQLFKEFLEKNQVLIVDKNSASRRRLTKTLCDMGGKRHLVDSVAHFAEAIEVIGSKHPKLILSDYAAIGGSGFDLFKEYRIKYPDTKDATLILITSNISQSAVAKAAEEDVDSFIIKPYTVTSLENSLMNAVIGKLYPNPYVQAIDEGKELLFSGDFEKAEEVFEKAMGLNKKPSLALFYHGQAQYFMKLNEEAGQDYKKGLNYNSIHFKCQVGLYELFQKENKFPEAYEVVKNIAKYFPANPDRLKEVIRLAMVTGNYDDMSYYYELFKDLDERTDELVNYVCSGLYIYGKYCFRNLKKDKAREVFDWITVSCAGMTKFLRAAIRELYVNGQYIDGQKILSKFPASSYSGEDYQVSAYLAEADDMNSGERITKGIDLINNGHKDLTAMMVLIKTLREEDKADVAEDYLFEASKLWPEKFKVNKAA